MKVKTRETQQKVPSECQSNTSRRTKITNTSNDGCGIAHNPVKYQRDYPDTELGEDIVDWDHAIEYFSSDCRHFIDDEEYRALEDFHNGSDEDFDENDCRVLAIYTKDEENAMEDLEYLLDFDNSSSDDNVFGFLRKEKKSPSY